MNTTNKNLSSKEDPSPTKQLNLYFTAGIPQLQDTTQILKLLQDSGADRVEIGMPYSDPVADGPVIQKAHELALKNGMTIQILLDQLKSVKEQIHIPIVLMGYINPVLSFGFERFCKACEESGVTGLIIPDLPAFEFEKTYRPLIEKYGLEFTFLVTPETPVERIQYLDSLSSGFLYAVSSSSTTGNSTKNITNESYLKTLASLELKNPVMIGFGIQSQEDFQKATRFSQGGIIGTALVKILLEKDNWEEKAKRFVHGIKA
ncbi:tryptophan synthase subunit alpha [Chryseobacterium sp. A301]